MIEKWKVIKDYTYYEVSNFGRVKKIKSSSIFERKNKIYPYFLKPVLSNEYPAVGLSKDGKSKTKRIHRLVAEAFIINENNYKEVAHKDGDRENNKINNLYWCTAKENADDKKKHGTYIHGEKAYNAKLTKDKILSAKESLKNGVSISTISKKLNVHYSTLYRAIKGKTYKFISIIVMLSFLASCSPSLLSSFCATYIPVYTDSLDKEITDQIDDNNAVWLELCD